MLESATCLKLRLYKCVIVPIDKAIGESDIIALLNESVPEWLAMSISGYAKFLGFYVGPNAAGVGWEPIIAKIKLRIRIIRNLRLGIPRSVILFNAVAFSCIAYRVSLVSPPKM